MSNNEGRNTDNAVPRKLAKGMAVVVYIRPNAYLLSYERVAGLDNGKWHKAKLVRIYATTETTYPTWQIEINGYKTVLSARSSIIIRSTSYADNGQAYHTKRNKRTYAARKAIKELGKFNQFSGQ